MERERVAELHYITPISNLASIGTHGLLSHRAAEAVDHISVALPDVQDRRARKVVPNGGPLHSYANLYFDARNPMMYYLTRHGHDDLIVMRVAPTVLDISGAIVTDGNAAADTTRFLASPSGLSFLEAELVYSDNWNSNDYWQYVEQKRARCAEALVPNSVLPNCIVGCYTSNNEHAEICKAAQPHWKVEVNKHVYFR
ncbi:DUF4433 domain-containing protein [Streptomyces sp. NPDC004539]|uniref:DUF4433 domain-containing protein n=1 Tax=Streptomyces sp. NPDC004539 TaxID=3154280 RepID=UPI0033AF15B8